MTSTAIIPEVSTAVHYRTIRVGEVDIFYREAGSQSAPALLLLQPASSYPDLIRRSGSMRMGFQTRRYWTPRPGRWIKLGWSGPEMPKFNWHCFTTTARTCRFIRNFKRSSAEIPIANAHRLGKE